MATRQSHSRVGLDVSLSEAASVRIGIWDLGTAASEPESHAGRVGQLLRDPKEPVTRAVGVHPVRTQARRLHPQVAVRPLLGVDAALVVAAADAADQAAGVEANCEACDHVRLLSQGAV